MKSQQNDILYPINKDTILVAGKWNLQLSARGKNCFFKTVELNDHVFDMPELEKKISKVMGEEVRIISARELR